MTLNEIRLFAVIRERFARQRVERVARARALPSLRGDAHADTDRVVDRRQAMWRLRC